MPENVQQNQFTNAVCVLYLSIDIFQFAQMVMIVKAFIPQSVAGGPASTSSVWDKVGIPARGNALYKVLEDGVAYDIFHNVADLTQLDKKDVAKAIHLAPATLARRAKSGKFNRQESDAFYRFTEVVSAAVDLFEGDQHAANQWLIKPVKGLGNRRPVDMLGTTAETEAVLDLIGRLEHGVFA